MNERGQISAELAILVCVLIDTIVILLALFSKDINL